MKRIAIITVTIYIICVLGGCGSARETNRRYTVSALGFDVGKDGLTVCAEALVVNSESTDRSVTTEVFTASAATPDECVHALGAELSKSLMFSHCGVIAVGDGVSGELLSEIITYCRNQPEVNLSAYVVSAPSAAELLSGEALSALAVGYEIMGMLDRSSEESGIMYGNRIYEIEGARLKKTPVYMLPRFSVSQGRRFLQGAVIMLGEDRVMELTESEAAVCSVIRNMNRGGSIGTGEGVRRVVSPYTYFNVKSENGGLLINADVRLSPEGSDEELCAWLEEKARELLSRADGADVFGFADRVYSESRKAWAEIENDCAAAMADATVKITCKLRQNDNGD